MRTGIAIVSLLMLAPGAVLGGDNKPVLPLPCGIYDEAMKPLIRKALRTQSNDRAESSMETTTRSGKQLRVEVRHVPIYLPGERNHVAVLLDGKPLARTSHQDVPLYLEVYVDEARYRVICVRADDEDAGEDLMSGGALSIPASGPQSQATVTNSPEAGRGRGTGTTPSAPSVP